MFQHEHLRCYRVLSINNIIAGKGILQRCKTKYLKYLSVLHADTFQEKILLIIGHIDTFLDPLYSTVIMFWRESTPHPQLNIIYGQPLKT